MRSHWSQVFQLRVTFSFAPTPFKFRAQELRRLLQTQPPKVGRFIHGTEEGPGPVTTKVTFGNMEKSMTPLCILLFSGKRKSGKDYFTDRLWEACDKEKFVIIKISAPIKYRFAKEFSLELSELMGTGEYKEIYRKEMINWSEEMRTKDPGVFCKAAVEMYNANLKPIWIVSDIRRKSDIKWFTNNFGEKVKTVRIEASDDVRKSRGWVFTPGIDDVASECDLDDYKHWDWKLENNGDTEKLKKLLSIIKEYLDKILLVAKKTEYSANLVVEI